MSMDNQYSMVEVSGGTSQQPQSLDQILAELEAGTSVLFAQGVYSLTASRTLAPGVTLVFTADAELDGGEKTLTLPEGRIILGAAVEEFTLKDVTIAGGVANSALITAERTVTDPQAELEFNASGVTLNPGSGASALSFERPATGTRDIAVTPAGSGATVDSQFGIDLGSGLDTTILPKVYQQQQGEIALAKGLVSVNSPKSFKLATVTIDLPHPEDVLSFGSEAHTLAGLLRVSLDFDAEAGVLTIAPAEGRLLNAGLIELLLDSVKFNNTSSEPGLSRSFTYELTDRDGQTISATAILQINDLNAPPVLELNAIDPGWELGDATATFVQAGPAVDITTNAAISLTDAEDDAIKFVTVQITDAVDSAAESLLLRDSVKPGDLFGLSPAALATLAGVTVAYDSASSTLTLQASPDLLDDGIATTDLFEYLLNEVKYANTSANPAAGGNTTRTIEVLAKDTLNNSPMMSEALTFIIDIEADDLDAINAATDAAGMRTAIADTPELEELLDDPKFDGLSEPRQNALLLDLVENRPETDGYTAFTQFSDAFFAPLADAYDAIRQAVAEPSVANIQAALDALPAELTVSGEPGLDKAALQAQLDTFDSLTVLKQPILVAVADVGGFDSLVGLVGAIINEAPGVVVAQVNAATTPAGIQDILTDVFVYASGGPVDGYGALQAASQDFAALALLQGRGTEGYGDFATLEAAFTAAVALGAAGEAFVTAANAADVNGLLAAANAGLDALDGISIDAFDKTALGSAIDAFETLVSARQAAVANDLQASVVGDWSLADLYGSNLLALTGALVEFRVATAAAVDQASDGVLTLQALQDVADALANIADKKADAQVNDTNIADLAPGAATELERLTDLSPNRLKAVLEDVSEGSFTSFAQLSAQLNTVLVPREGVQAAVEGLVEKANGATGLAVADFDAVQTALQAIVTANLRETLTDGTPVEDISAADLAAAISLFGNLSQATRDATLATVQAGDGYTTLGSVLDAFEPAIQGVLLDALNAAENSGDVSDVLEDAARVFPEVPESLNQLVEEASALAVFEFFAVRTKGDEFDNFAEASAFFRDAIAFAKAGEDLVDAINNRDAAEVRDQLATGRDKLAAMGIDLGDENTGVTVAVLDRVVEAIDGLVPGRFEAAITDLADSAPTGGWTVSSLYDGSLTSLADGLILFRVEVQDAVNAAGDTTAGSFGAGSLDALVTALQVVEDKSSEARINGQPVSVAIDAVQPVADDLNALVPGRAEALNADLAANANTNDGFSSFTAMFQVLEPLVAFRVAVQTAVEAGKAGTLGVAELAEVQAKLVALDGKTVNGQPFDADAANEAFDALIGRVNDLVPGRFVALQNDLGANGDSFASFTAMIGLFDGLLTFREAVQDAVTAGSDGSLALADIEAITTALEALPAGTKVNNTDVGDVIAGQNQLEALLGDDQLIPGRFAALAADLGANAGDGFGSYTAMVTLLQPLAEFRIELGEAVEAAGEGGFARGAEGTLEGVLAKLEAVAAVKSDATINGQEIAGIITDKQALIDTVNGLSPDGRFDAFAADLASNAPYSSFTDMIGTLEPLLEFRTAVQTAVEAGKAGTLGVAELAEVQAKLVALDGKTVNDETVVAADVNTAFDALIGRVDALVPGRLVALQNDLEANGDSFASFTAMIGLFDGLLTFREAVQDAVTAGSDGSLALADITAITTALRDLPEGTEVNNTDVAQVIAGQNELEALLGDDQLIPGRFAALAADLGANAGDGFGSYTAMVTLLAPLAEFRIELGEAVEAAGEGGFARGAEGTLEGVLAKLEAVAAVKPDATINGQEIAGIITDKQALIARVNALSNDPEPRFDAFVEDLKGSYSSFTALITRLGEVLEPREDVQAAVNAVIEAADGTDEGALTVERFEEVRDALLAIENAGLTTEVGGEPVEDISGAALAAKLVTFGDLRPATQEAVLAEVQTGSFATLGGVLDAFPAALDNVGLDLVNVAETATELLDALEDIAVYVTDNAALNAVLALDAPRAEALANDFLLNSDGDFTSLSEAGDLLAVLEDVYSGLDVNFDAGFFTLGTKGDAFFTLDVGDDSVKLANIGSIAFDDTTAHVAGNGALQTLTEAVAAAGADDAILLSAGEFAEAVVVDKSGVALFGANYGVAGNDTRAAETQITETLRFGADSVTVDGIEFVVAANSRGVAPARSSSSMACRSRQRWLRPRPGTPSWWTMATTARSRLTRA